MDENETSGGEIRANGDLALAVAEALALYLSAEAENRRLKAEGKYLRARIAQEGERLGGGVG